MKRFGLLIVLAALIALILANQAGLVHFPHFNLAALTGSVNAASGPAASGNLVCPSCVIGKPSISEAMIARQLQAAHSPAQGDAALMYSAGVRSGIDPAFALAFFAHESRYGTLGVATMTHSLGNIRCSVGYTCRDGFRSYATWGAGIVDWYVLIKQTYVSRLHLTTIGAIIPVYAPSADGNNVNAYILAVMTDVSAWRAGNLM